MPPPLQKVQPLFSNVKVGELTKQAEIHCSDSAPFEDVPSLLSAVRHPNMAMIFNDNNQQSPASCDLVSELRPQQRIEIKSETETSENSVVYRVDGNDNDTDIESDGEMVEDSSSTESDEENKTSSKHTNFCSDDSESDGSSNSSSSDCSSESSYSLKSKNVAAAPPSDKDSICTACGRGPFRLLKLHLLHCRGIQVEYECSLCKRLFLTEASRNEHYIPLYACEMCGQVFSHESLYLPHQCPKDGKSPLVLFCSEMMPKVCNICKSFFTSEKTLLNHVTKVHTSVVSTKIRMSTNPSVMTDSKVSPGVHGSAVHSATSGPKLVSEVHNGTLHVDQTHAGSHAKSSLSPSPTFPTCLSEPVPFCVMPDAVTVKQEKDDQHVLYVDQTYAGSHASVAKSSPSPSPTFPSSFSEPAPLSVMPDAVTVKLEKDDQHVLHVDQTYAGPHATSSHSHSSTLPSCPSEPAPLSVMPDASTVKQEKDDQPVLPDTTDSPATVAPEPVPPPVPTIMAISDNDSQDVALMKHMNMGWSTKVPYSCRKCGAILRQQDGISHRYQTRGRRSHQCQCGQAFNLDSAHLPPPLQKVPPLFSNVKVGELTIESDDEMVEDSSSTESDEENKTASKHTNFCSDDSESDGSSNSSSSDCCSKSSYSLNSKDVAAAPPSDKDSICTACGRGPFRLLKLHLLHCRGIQVEYECSLCKRLFLTEAALNEHYIPLYACEMCGQVFSQKSSCLHQCPKEGIFPLVLFCSEMMPKVCNICKSFFTSEKTLLNHVTKVHTSVVSTKIRMITNPSGMTDSKVSPGVCGSANLMPKAHNGTLQVDQTYAGSHAKSSTSPSSAFPTCLSEPAPLSVMMDAVTIKQEKDDQHVFHVDQTYAGSHASFAKSSHSPSATFPPCLSEPAPLSMMLDASTVKQEKDDQLILPDTTDSPATVAPEPVPPPVPPIMAISDNDSQDVTLMKRMNMGWRAKVPYSCRECGAIMRQLSSIICHRYLHRGRRSHQCRCGRAFKRRLHLLRHCVQHAEAESYICVSCGETFVGARHLAEHKQGKSQKKFHRSGHTQRCQVKGKCRTPFTCDCGRLFLRPSALIWHQIQNWTKSKKKKKKKLN